MEDIGRVVRLFPAFGQIRLDDEGPRLHVGADFMSHQAAVYEAQDVIRIVIDREMRIKVRQVSSTYT